MLSPTGVLASATFDDFLCLVGNILLDDVGSMASFPDIGASTSDVLPSAVKAIVLNELGPGVCPGPGSTALVFLTL